ncbi:MAG TPA: outer membrane protein transport protein [Candidatus Binataceae bacterium]
MPNKNVLAMVVLLLLASIVRPTFARAGGFFLSEIGTPDLGLASAGYASRAQDASTVFTNPAGMTRLDQSQLLVGVQPIYGHEVFSPNGQTTTTGPDGGNAILPLPGASVFYVYNLTKNLKLGIGNCTYFGGALEYNKNWVGRYYLQGATILGSSILPSIAYRVNDWLSVGGGFNIMVGYLDERVAINTLLVRNSDGQMTVKDWTAGIGGDIGVLVEPDSHTRFGVQYLTPVSLDFGGVPHFSGLGPGLVHLFKKHGIFGASLDLNMTVPQSLLFSAFHEFSDRLAIMGDAGWQNWSQFGNLGIGINSVNPKSATVNLKYQDTFHLAIGAQYKLSPPLTLSSGFAFDNSMVSGPSRTVSAPVGNQYRFGLGAQYALSEALIAGFGYEFQWQGDLGMFQSHNRVQGTVAGRFSDVNINFFNINLVWKLGSTGH